jgi:hypothetical protein
MQIQMVTLDGETELAGVTYPGPGEAAVAARRAGWCWPPIEGEPDSRPLLIATDILEDHLRSGDQALLCSADGRRFVRLAPAG